jgi:hypothetical protein
MENNKRLAIKHVRDRAKAAYEKQGCCYICGSEDSLELHHWTPLTRHLEKWARLKKYNITTDAGILAVRDEYITENHNVLYIMVSTLCSAHHEKLHKIYGKSPLLGTENAQGRWIEKQRIKTLANE